MTTGEKGTGMMLASSGSGLQNLRNTDELSDQEQEVSNQQAEGQ